MFSLRNIISILLLLVSTQAGAISMRTAAIDAVGGVTISWDRSATSAAGFRSWYIYHSATIGGPFSLVDSVFFYNDTTELHPGALAASNPALYYVVCKQNGGGPDIFSDTIAAINLSVVNTGSGFADLSWNPVRIPPVATNSPYYKIYREYPAGFFTLIDSVNVNLSSIPMTYSDLISICDDTIKYRIEVEDASGLKSVSSVKGQRFQDLQTPVIPLIDSVSVNAGGFATVAWLTNPSPDTRYYVILLSSGSGSTAIDTVYGVGSTFFTTPVDVTGGAVSFSVIAVDSCNNPSAQSNPHSSMHLDISFNVCEKAMKLSWTGYDFWPSQVTYEILRSVNGGPESVIGLSTTTTFVDTMLTSGMNYCYRARALEPGLLRTSTSNVSCLTPVFPPPPAFSYIRKVTVRSEDEVYVEAYVDPAASVSGYRLLRATDSLGPYSEVTSQMVTGVAVVGFSDFDVDPSSAVYYYKVETLDSCGLSSMFSQVSHTILLSVIPDPEYLNIMSWSPYGNWPAGVDHYNIYLSINGIAGTDPLVTLSSDTLFFTDEVLNRFISDGEFCYVVEAIESNGNPYFLLDTSRSNEVCVRQQPIIYIPNAFHPGGGLNEIFYPSNAFVSAEDYDFYIYNRWGSLVFHTDNPKVGWDGTTNGTMAPEAVYIYLLKAKQPDGGAIEKVGSVTLIR